MPAREKAAREHGRGQRGDRLPPALGPSWSPWDRDSPGTGLSAGRGPPLLLSLRKGASREMCAPACTRPAALLLEPRLSPAGRKEGLASVHFSAGNWEKEVIRSPYRIFSPPVPNATHPTLPQCDALSYQMAGLFISPFVAAATKALI